jgi:formylglycine-generating enzyme
VRSTQRSPVQLSGLSDRLTWSTSACTREAQAYVAWLRRRTGKPYRFPTEAEWEYAARAGTRTAYSFGNDENALCTYARFADLGSQFGWRDGCRSDTVTYGPLPVGSLKPNPWGLFDMHGNAWEWVEDCYEDSYELASPLGLPRQTASQDVARAGTGPLICGRRVLRGGSWVDAPVAVRAAYRHWSAPGDKTDGYGFRVARSLNWP